nr:immunoglobulin light chain junction region [Macaca mulatta]
CLQHNSYPPMF